MAEEIRRVVVGPDGQAGTVVYSDGAAPATMELPAVPGTRLTDLWRSDRVPVPVPTDQDPTAADFALMPPGSLFRVIDLAPTGDTEPMWHQTDSVDYVYIASGSARFLHDGGAIELGAGDSIVVGGVRHAWVNHSDGTCRIVDVSVARA